MTSFADLRAQFEVGPGYLNAASAGVAPRVTRDALVRDLAGWSAGQTRAEGYDAAVRRAREAYARIVSVDSSRVAVGSQVSVGVSLFADWVPDGGEVLCVAGDFASVGFPFLAQGSRITVRHVPVAELADAVSPQTVLVAYSLVQSAGGQVADHPAISEAASRVGARTLCDVTQATGWLPVDATQFDATVCGAYKWLCSPRGSAFITVSEEFARELRPVHAGWYAGDEVWASCYGYGPEMSLATDARRFDVSPAWSCWVGAAESLELIADVDPQEIAAYGVGLADRFLAGLDLGPRGSAIVALPDPDGVLQAALEAAGCVVAGRAGGVRLAFHVWNDQDDVDRAVQALRAVRVAG